MKHPQNFLLEKIVQNEKNGLTSLGKLHGMHVKDVAEVMRMYAEETVIEVVERLNAGEEIIVGNVTLKSKKIDTKNI